jgi:hypothetical protein
LYFIIVGTFVEDTIEFVLVATKKIQNITVNPAVYPGNIQLLIQRTIMNLQTCVLLDKSFLPFQSDQTSTVCCVIGKPIEGGKFS